MTVKFVDARRGTIVMDVTNEEGQEIGKNGRKQARRGDPQVVQLGRCPARQRARKSAELDLFRPAPGRQASGCEPEHVQGWLGT